MEATEPKINRGLGYLRSLVPNSRSGLLALIAAPGLGSFGSEALGAFVVNAGGVLAALVGQIILARWLGADQFGLFAYAFSWATFLTLVAVAGLDNTSLRFVAAYNATCEISKLRGYIRFAELRVGFFGVSIGLLTSAVLLTTPLALGTTKVKVFLVACLFIPWSAMSQLHGAILKGFKRVVWSCALQGVLRPLAVVAVIGVFTLGYPGRPSALSAMFANLITAIIITIVLALMWRRFMPKDQTGGPPAKRMREWRSVSNSMFAMSCSQFLLSQSDILIVGLILGTTEAGIYAVASRLAGIVTFGIVSLNSVLAPTIAELHARGKIAELQRTVTFSSWCVVLYTVPVLGLLAFFGKHLLGVFGTAFVEGYLVTILLGLGQFVVAMAGSVGFLLTMTGHQKEAAIVVIFSSLLGILFVSAFTITFGLAGAALGTMLATCCRSVILSTLVRRRLKISPFAFHVRPFTSALHRKQSS